MKKRGGVQDRDALVKSATECLTVLAGCVVTGMAETVLAEIAAGEFPDVPVADLAGIIRVARGLLLDGEVISERARAMATLVYLRRELAEAA